MRPRRPPGGVGRRALRNLRAGRAQQMLSAATAASALPLAIEVFVNHYGGSFASGREDHRRLGADMRVQRRLDALAAD
jgi:hypothetical protein